MIRLLDEDHFWWFHSLYAILATFADRPENAISRIGGGRISIPEDQGIELDVWYRSILETYPQAEVLEVMKVAAKINAILARRSAGGEGFDEWFWSNQGYLQHFEWDEIRELARAFLLR